jgi:hypothetical protein
MHPEEGEDYEAAVRRTCDAVAMTEKGRELMGGMLVPKGTRGAAWTPAMARQTSEHLGRNTTHSAKLLLARLEVSMLIAFFVTGLPCFVSSTTSSQAGRPAADASRGAVTGSGVPSSLH